jgi:hypothetical protein
MHTYSESGKKVSPRSPEVDYYHKVIDEVIESVGYDYGHRHVYAHFTGAQIPDIESVREAVIEERDSNSVLETEHRRPYELTLAMLSAEELWDGMYMGSYDGVTVAFDDSSIRGVCYSPDLSEAKSVICLDAHPKKHLWETALNTELSVERVMDPEEQRLWRVHERGLCVVDVSNGNKRPLSNRWNGDNDTEERKARQLIGRIRSEFGNEFRTAITSKDVKKDVEEFLGDAGAEEPDLMHYQNQKGSNDFEDESVGVLIGCIEMGDGDINSRAALCGSRAHIKDREDPGREIVTEGIEMSEEEAKEFREGFISVDILMEVVESVREENVAQAIGRYARSPEDDSKSVVYVWTKQIPEGLVDVEAGGVDEKENESRIDIKNAVKNYDGDGLPDTGELIEATEYSRSKITQEAKEVECIERHGPRNQELSYEYIGGDVSPWGVDLGLDT